MNETQTLILDKLRARRDRLVDIAVTSVELNPDQKADSFPRADLEQMVEGTYSAMTEFFEIGPRPFWDIYLHTVIPGILSMGFRIPQVLNTVTSFYMLCAVELDRSMDGDRRDAAGREFARFGAAWLSAIASCDGAKS